MSFNFSLLIKNTTTKMVKQKKMLNKINKIQNLKDIYATLSCYVSLLIINIFQKKKMNLR